MKDIHYGERTLLTISLNFGFNSDSPKYHGICKLCINAIFLYSKLNKQDFFNGEFKKMQGEYTINVKPTKIDINFSYFKVQEEKFWLLLTDAFTSGVFRQQELIFLLKKFKWHLRTDYDLDQGYGIYRVI